MSNESESNEVIPARAEESKREGTLTSARFNILSTMVGGGSLSLPLAFYQAGNVFTAPLLLLAIAFLAQCSIHFLVQASLIVFPPKEHKGIASFEGVAEAAFGMRAKYFCRVLLSVICFCSVVGYAVLLRDTMEPLSDFIFGNDSLVSRTHHNITMMIFILIITPLSTLKDLTPLQKVGKLSMASLTTLACIISYRSFQCNFQDEYKDIRKSTPWDYMTYTPMDYLHSQGAMNALWSNVTNALPILLSVFMCHFNVLPVVNELQRPMENQRLKRLFSSCIWGAALFYIFFGVSGSMYGNCVEDGVVDGNILLSFGADDKLLGIGRACLSLTIMCAFPILVVPCRDIVLRAWVEMRACEMDRVETTDMDHVSGRRETNEDMYERTEQNDLTEPLLSSTDEEIENIISHDEDKHIIGDHIRIISSILILWLAAGLACFVTNIDIVWDILGGSFSLMMGFLIPSGSFLILRKKRQHSIVQRDDESNLEQLDNVNTNNAETTACSRDEKIAIVIIMLIVPVMIILTSNVIYTLANAE
jgi:amino acid permease